jgi:hypothetical protein
MLVVQANRYNTCVNSGNDFHPSFIFVVNFMYYTRLAKFLRESKHTILLRQAPNYTTKSVIAVSTNRELHYKTFRGVN